MTLIERLQGALEVCEGYTDADDSTPEYFLKDLHKYEAHIKAGKVHEGFDEGDEFIFIESEQEADIYVDITLERSTERGWHVGDYTVEIWD